MNPDQELVSWLALILLGFAVWFVYKPQMKDILFKSPSS